MRAVRSSQTRLTQRLERLEVERVVETAALRQPRGPEHAPRSISASAAAGAPELAMDPDGEDALAPPGQLTVVKLAPKRTPAPKLSTQVAIVEPSETTLTNLTAVAKGRKPAAAGEVDEESAREREAVRADDELEYDAALGDLRSGNAESGVARLRRFASSNPRHPLADNALYFAGVGLMGLGDYKAAADAFDNLLDSHPAGDAVAQGLLRLAECRVRLSQPADAKALYQRVVKTFPGTEAAAQAEQRLASISRTR